MPIRKKLDIPDNWELKVIRSLDHIETIRPVWENLHLQELSPTIDADIDRYLSVLKIWEGKSRPYIILLKQNDQPRAMVIGRLEKWPLPIRIGYKTILRPKLRCLTVVFGGLLGQPDEWVSSLLIRELLKFLRLGEIDVIFFSHLRIESIFYQQVRKIPNFICRNHFPVIHPHWRMDIPQNIDDFFKALTKDTRESIRRKIRRFEKKYQNQFNILHYHRQDEIKSFSKDVEELSQKTYQHALNAGFVNNSLTNSILNTDARYNRLFISVFNIHNKPCAYQWGTILNHTYYLEKLGYDPQWAKYSIGTILFIKVLELLCVNKSLRYVDFWFGDAQYKKSYANETWQEAATTYIFAPRFYPLLINSINTLITGFNMSLTWILNKLKVYNWVKRFWRRKLQKKTV